MGRRVANDNFTCNICEGRIHRYSVVELGNWHCRGHTFHYRCLWTRKNYLNELRHGVNAWNCPVYSCQASFTTLGPPVIKKCERCDASFGWRTWKKTCENCDAV